MKRYEAIAAKCVIGVIILASLLLAFFSMAGIDTSKQLMGSTIDAPEPEVQLETVLNGACQTAFDNWFVENFSFRYYFVKLYNQLMFCLGETNNNIVVGKNNYLYGRDYVETFVHNAVVEERDAVFDQYAEKIRHIQDYCLKNGKTFIYIISPSKAVIYPEYIPDRYLTLYREDTESNLTYEKKAFEAMGVSYVDANREMYELKNLGIQPYYKQGIHWSGAASAKFLEGLNGEYHFMPGRMQVALNLTSDSPVGGEIDLYNLANVYENPLYEQFWETSIRFEDNTEEYRNIFILGTSFSGWIVEILNGRFSDDTPKFNELVHYDYLNAGYYYHDGIMDELEMSYDLSQTNIEQAVLNSDVIIFENNSSYIPDSYYLVAEYLDNILCE